MAFYANKSVASPAIAERRSLLFSLFPPFISEENASTLGFRPLGRDVDGPSCPRFRVNFRFSFGGGENGTAPGLKSGSESGSASDTSRRIKFRDRDIVTGAEKRDTNPRGQVPSA